MKYLMAIFITAASVSSFAGSRSEMGQDFNSASSFAAGYIPNTSSIQRLVRFVNLEANGLVTFEAVTYNHGSLMSQDRLQLDSMAIEATEPLNSALSQSAQTNGTWVSLQNN
jgi:hypothetical protein